MIDIPVNEYPLKRPFDFLLALTGLTISSPLWLVICLAIFFEDLGPVLFLQERCGRNGKIFNIIKFRTMQPVAKGKMHDVTYIENDPRVTKIGRVLRPTAMDELPTLINILKGDMSFVGPRPLPFKVGIKHQKKYDNITQVPGYQIRSRVKPGLTGMAQIYAPKDIDHIERFNYDNIYIERMSLWLDLKLILLSFWVTFKGKWEQTGKKL